MLLNKAVHKGILLKILHDIYTDSFLSPCLGFKGGTAAMLFYDLPRFSVDLDFDLLIPEKATEVFDRMSRLLSKYGRMKESKNMNNGIFFILSYDGKATNSYNMKVDINKRDFGSSYELKNYLGIPIKVMNRDDMLAHKLVAMYERLADANRDIYDVWFFLKNSWPLKVSTVEKRTQMPFGTFLDRCINGIATFDDKSILSGGLGDLLDDEAKKFSKNKLKDETLFLLRLLKNSL